MESDDENLVIALDHLNVDEALPDPEGAGDDEAPADVHKSETGAHNTWWPDANVQCGKRKRV